MKIRLAGETDREYQARTQGENRLITASWYARQIVDAFGRGLKLAEISRINRLYEACGVKRESGGTVKVNIPKQYRSE